MANKITKDLDQRSWDEFRSSGMLFFVNTLLHFMGWAITVNVKDGKVTGVFPARTRFRGFTYTDQTEQHYNVARYLRDNAPNFPTEVLDSDGDQSVLRPEEEPEPPVFPEDRIG